MSKNESYELRPSVPIIRVFRARARQGCKRALADKLAISSVQVVQGQPGSLGYLVADADALKVRFGQEWRDSLLPPGYAELIEECYFEHDHLTEQSPVPGITSR